MPKNLYYVATTILLDENLYEKIKAGIDVFYITRRTEVGFNKNVLYSKLVELLENHDTNLSVTPKWLLDFYAGRKTGHNCNKAILNALYVILDIEDNNDAYYINLIEKFKSLCFFDAGIADFAGKYKLFIGGRYQPSIYDIAYDLPLEIFENGIVKITQTYTKRIYWALALLRDINTLEIISFDFQNEKIRAVGGFLMFKINGYKRRQMYFPGVDYGFDSSAMPVIYQAFLSADAQMGRDHPIVINYFSEITNNLRMECPQLTYTEQLRHLFLKQ